MKKSYIVVLYFFILVCSSVQAQINDNYSVTGRVVDLKGDPVENVIITAAMTCPNCLDILDQKTKTFKDGGFDLKFTSSIIGSRFYIDDVVPSGTWSPLSYLSPDQRDGIKELRSIRSIKRNIKETKFGKIVMPYKYSVMEIDLRSFMNLKDYNSLTLKIYNKNNQLIDTGHLPKVNLNDPPNILSLALPASAKGTIWSLEFVSDTYKTNSLKARFLPANCQRYALNKSEWKKSVCNNSVF